MYGSGGVYWHLLVRSSRCGSPSPSKYHLLELSVVQMQLVNFEIVLFKILFSRILNLISKLKLNLSGAKFFFYCIKLVYILAGMKSMAHRMYNENVLDSLLMEMRL